MRWRSIEVGKILCHQVQVNGGRTVLPCEAALGTRYGNHIVCLGKQPCQCELGSEASCLRATRLTVSRISTFASKLDAI